MSCFIICIAVVDLNQEEIISIDVDCWCYFCYYYQHLLLKRALFSPFLKHNEKQSKRLFKGHLWYKLFHTDRQTDRQTQSAQLNELVAVEKNQSGDDNAKRQVSFERHHWQPARRSPFHSLTHLSVVILFVKLKTDYYYYYYYYKFYIYWVTLPDGLNTTIALQPLRPSESSSKMSVTQ